MIETHQSPTPDVTFWPAWTVGLFLIFSDRGGLRKLPPPSLCNLKTVNAMIIKLSQYNEDYLIEDNILAKNGE